MDSRPVLPCSESRKEFERSTAQISFRPSVPSSLISFPFPALWWVLLAGCQSPVQNVSEPETRASGDVATCHRAFKNQRWDEAIACYETLLQRQAMPEVEGQYWLSRSYSGRDGRIGANPSVANTQTNDDRRRAADHAHRAWDLMREEPAKRASKEGAAVGLHYANCLRDLNQMDEALAVYREIIHTLPAGSEDQARALHRLGEVQFDRALTASGSRERSERLDEAFASAAEARAVVETLTRVPPELGAEVFSLVGRVERERLNLAEAERALSRAEEFSRSLQGTLLRAQVLRDWIAIEAELGRAQAVRDLCKELKASASKHHPQTLNLLGYASILIGDPLAARTQLDLARATAASDPICRTDVRFLIELDLNSAAAEQQIGDLTAAEQRLESAEARAARDSVDVRTQARVLANRGRMYLSIERLNEAESALEKSLNLFEGLSGPQDPDALHVRGDLASLARTRGYLNDARQEAEQALRGWTAIRDADHPETAFARLDLAKIMQQQMECPPALQEVRTALNALRDHLSPSDKRWVMACLDALHIALSCDGQTGADALVRELRPETEAGLRRLSSDFGLRSVEVLRALVLAADVSTGIPEARPRALENYIQAEEGFRALSGGDGTLSIANIRWGRGRLLERMDRPAEAAKIYETGERSMDAGFRRHPTRARLLAALGDLQRKAGNEAVARTCFQEADSIMDETYGSQSPVLQQFRQAHPP